MRYSGSCIDLATSKNNNNGSTQSCGDEAILTKRQERAELLCVEVEERQTKQ